MARVATLESLDKQIVEKTEDVERTVNLLAKHREELVKLEAKREELLTNPDAIKREAERAEAKLADLMDKLANPEKLLEALRAQIASVEAAKEQLAAMQG